jgi:hypothetical protein
LYKPQHVLDFLIVCKHLQDKTDQYHETCCGLYKSWYWSVLSCRCLHTCTIRKSRTCCGLYKSWYLSVLSCRCL